MDCGKSVVANENVSAAMVRQARGFALSASFVTKGRVMNFENHKSVRLCVALAALVMATNPNVASAADLPQTMSTKAPPPAAAAAAPFHWSGLYAGGHFGYLWGRTRVDDNGITTEHNARTDGVIGGAMIGYNWQFGRVVFGVEGDFGWTNARGVGEGEPPPPPPPPPVLLPITTHGPNSYDVRWSSHARGRLGFAFGSWLMFATAGIAASDLSFREGAINTTFVPASTSGGKYYGWSVGGGVETALTSNLIGRVEYFYDDFGHKDYVGVLGNPYRVSLTGHRVRAALAWKFGP